MRSARRAERSKESKGIAAETTRPDAQPLVDAHDSLRDARAAGLEAHDVRASGDRSARVVAAVPRHGVFARVLAAEWEPPHESAVCGHDDEIEDTPPGRRAPTRENVAAAE